MVLGARLRALLDRVLRRRPAPEVDPDEAGEVFRDRYHALRLLLAANTKALGLMAEMERAAVGDHVFGTSFVAARCTALGVCVYRMVRLLDTLAPGRYAELSHRLDALQQEIAALLAPATAPRDAPWTLPLSAVGRDTADLVGAKMAHLGEVANAVGLRVPPGFAITAAAFRRFVAAAELQPAIDRVVQASQASTAEEVFALSSRLQQMLLEAPVPEDVAEAILSAADALAADTGGTTFALRSSALGEDTAEASFAGQYRSLLNVRRSSLLDAWREVVASKYTPQAMHYRLHRGLRDDEVAMAVGCLAMVEARSGGVAYTGNPRSADDYRVFLSSTWGLPTAVVDGRDSTDETVLTRTRPPLVVERRVADKTTRFDPDPGEGVRRREVPPADRHQPSVGDAEAVEVAEQALRLEEHFGTPVDVEWAVDADGAVVVLQCRPLRQVGSAPHRPPPVDAPPPAVRGGVCASPGVAAGRIHWVRRDSDTLTFEDGSVLVLSQPLPRWAALLGRAGAVVAEEGGMAGHLATVAREFGVPALLGTGLLSGLSDGLDVTVDAGGLAVYPGRVEPLLEDAVTRSRLMVGSPVHRLLLDVLARIAPLNLLDPDGVDFRADRCTTLHDMTRFCHERAVREMFDFGRHHPFPRHASKQLHHHVPMQWWVLDLEDGLRGPVEGRFVRLDDIASAPMLALWEGMVAVPWDGPPAASGRGLAAVLFEATTNPALASPFGASYAQRNYFMISRQFMNLQSRFGFHFSTVEALVSDREMESYVTFSFKGGAADRTRRATRARLIATILEDQGFSVEVVEDTASARVLGLPATDARRKLRILGYLLMHTRQLDVIMADPDAVAYYRDKLLADIAKLE